MSSSDININGGKGKNIPTAQGDKNYRDNYALAFGGGKPRTTHANTLAFGGDDKKPALQPVAPEE